MIEARTDEVWEYVGSPEMWPFFHVKVGECSQIGTRRDELGALYEIEFRLGSRTNMTRCEILEYRIGRLITVESTLPEGNQTTGREQFALLTYELLDLGSRTRVMERVEFSGARIPFVLRALVWLLSRFGDPAGETTLMRLKRIVEE